uniref:HSF-type DNA-binding domain-containing protein n=1 Tax=Anas platyrhynchos TaxID=8839 RepID=A0A8B9SZL0_ANAPL
MEGPAGAAAAAAVGTGPGSNVPAFLTKLWTLVEDPDTDPLICWSPSGNSFHVFDQGQFAKEVLPKYFKHNNMASFVRQLNMYGFRKVVHIEQGGLVKPEKDDTEFQHPYFIRGQEHLLENIKRKVTSVSSIKNEDIKVRQDNVTKLLTDIQVMKGKQESMDSKLIAMKHENEALWREVASLRQKHAQQQKVVNKLIQFLISLVQSNRILGVKRKIPLMLNDSSSAHSMPKYSRQYSLEHVHGSSPYAASSPAYSGSNLYSPDSSANSGPIISDVTELAQSSPSASPSGSLDERSSPVVRIKEEPPSPSRSPKIEENEPSTTTAAAGNSTTQPQPQEKFRFTPETLPFHLQTHCSGLLGFQDASSPQLWGQTWAFVQGRYFVLCPWCWGQCLTPCRALHPQHRDLMLLQGAGHVAAKIRMDKNACAKYGLVQTPLLRRRNESLWDQLCFVSGPAHPPGVEALCSQPQGS